VIDLHLHTTASDGRLLPADLVRTAHAAGLTVIAVTDHDTVAGLSAAREAAGSLGITLVPGIEITAVDDGRDVHMLGYFIDVDDAALAAFLARQRADRRRRIDEIVARLDALGLPLDRPLPGETGDDASAVGRPHVARALMAAGHVASIAEAFERFIGEHALAYVPRLGAPPADVISVVHATGGVASLAHPGKSIPDDRIDAMIDAGLAAVEVYHPDHSPEQVASYQRLVAMRGLIATGGSDYHGPGSGRADALGRVTLPVADFAALRARAGSVPGPHA
jgi:predicted metal-dependent phosphoesterase TrpH